MSASFLTEATRKWLALHQNLLPELTRQMAQDALIVHQQQQAMAQQQYPMGQQQLHQLQQSAQLQAQRQAYSDSFFGGNVTINSGNSVSYPGGSNTISSTTGTGQVIVGTGSQVPASVYEYVTAVERALALLEEKIGKAAVNKILAGGGYPIRSKWWETINYVVPRDPQARIRVIDRGKCVTESCLISRDPSLPWPDQMLQRIQAIEIDESIVYVTGVLYTQDHIAQAQERVSLLDRIRTRFRELQVPDPDPA